MSQVNIDRLRQQAEKLIADSEEKLRDVGLELAQQAEDEITAANVRRLLQELRIYQAELQIQNQELIDAQAGMLSSLEKYRNLFENLPLPALLLDSKGIVRQFNQAALQLFDLDAGRASMPRPVARLFHSDSQPILHRLLKPEAGDRVRSSKLFSRDLGQASRVLLEITALDLPSEDPQQVGTLLLIMDQSGELALQESEERFQLLANSAPVLVWVSGEGAAMRWFNQAWRDFTGHEAAQDLANGWLQTVHPDDRERIRQRLDQAYQEQKGFSTGLRLRRHDGIWRWMLNSAQPRFDERARLVGFVGVCIDHTERSELLQRLEKIAAHVPGMVYQYQLWPDGRSSFPYCSRGIREIYGLEPEQVCQDASPIFETLHPDDVARVTRSITQSAQQISLWRDQYRVLQKDGSSLWVEGEGSPERLDDGSVLWHGYIRDISDRKALELELKEQGQRLSNIIWGTDVGTWEWHIPSGEIRCNPRWAQMLGYRLEELEPMTLATWQRLTHVDDLAKAERLLQAHLEGRQDIYECEMRMRHKGGQWIWVLDRGRLISRDADGKPLWAAGTHQDITERRQDQERVRESEQRLKLIFEGINDGVWDWSLPDNRVYYSPRWMAQLGYGEHELEAGVETFFNLTHEEDVDRLMEVLSAYLAGEIPSYSVELRMRHKEGGWRWILARGTALRDEQGQPYRMLGSHTDITERKQSEAELELAASVFAHAYEAIMITDTQGLIIDINQAFTQITGYARDEAIGQTPHLLNSGHHQAEFFEVMWQQLHRLGHWQGEVWNRRKNGELFAEMLHISAVRDQQGQAHHYVALFSDITAQKQHQKELERIAHYDVLTGLPNRSLFSDRLNQAMANASRRDQRIALAFIDLDGFKAINDTHGHKMGDHLLRKVAQRMREACREGDTVARLGGDEFVALYIDLADLQASEPLLRRLLQAAFQPVQSDAGPLQVSASIGVAFYPQQEPIEADQLLRQADQAMYKAKMSGKNRYQVFDQAEDQSLRLHLDRVRQIETGLQQRQFQVYYQPKVNMRTGTILGFEALVRWQHPQKGLLLPEDFLPGIDNEEIGLRLGDWVLQQAIIQLGRWHEQGLDLSISVNISAHQLQQENFVQRLLELLESCPQARPQRLELEVLESHALSDMERVSELISHCSRLGVHFALDDFGTGYSSLTYLKRLPARVLKIDQGFVREMLGNAEELAIIDGVLGLSSAFRRMPVAEGVESKEHGEMLLRLGCDVGQGFHIARPMPVDELDAWMQNWQPEPSWIGIRRLEHERMPLLYAMVEHRHWISQLVDYLEDRLVAPPVLEHDQCRFGAWLETIRDDPQFNALNLYDKITPLHLQAHQLAAEMIQHKQVGADSELVQRLPALFAVRDELLRLLQTVIN